MANPNPKPPPKHGQIKKGEVRNPHGAKAHNPALRALRKLTVESYREIIELVMTSNVAAIRAIAENPKSTGIQVGIAVAFLKAIKSGDYNVIERIAERIVGKIPDQVNLNANVNAAVNATLTVIDKTKLKAAMDELEREV
jgi:hypothetical protein